MDVDLRPAEISEARLTNAHLVVVLADGRELATPLDWYPRLARASAEQRTKFELSPFGIHWADLDEDLSVEGMLAGRRPTDH